MKRTIFFELLLILILSVLISITVYFWDYISHSINLAAELDKVYFNDLYEDIYCSIYKFLPYAILSLITCIVDITFIILTLIKDFPIFKPFIDKYKIRKEQARIAKSQEKKQAKIDKIKTKLDKLEKD